ncbi:MAG: helix-turn-helix transcriptional regulator [Gammaproteobacteria bacterium]|jgi:transcriptional regulator with XRE-family HTH domain|nr:helix-turn-helix transcriptional regulator [Pseudomonadota bacterium]MCC6631552.1 helix-turn-helix transcriptional regulator [Gammaproteobacteria bacterium]
MLRESKKKVGKSNGPAVALQVGQNVRRLRQERGVNLSDLAASAGISLPMLSRLEKGDVTPSLETLVALAEALGTNASTLLKDEVAQQSDAQLVPKGEGLEVVQRGTRRGHTYHLLASDRGPKRVFEPYLVTLTDKSEVFPEFDHPGVEFIHVLEGSLRYRHGPESYLLKPGDSLTFRGDVPHGPDKLLKLPVRMLSIIIYGGGEAD